MIFHLETKMRKLYLKKLINPRNQIHSENKLIDIVLFLEKKKKEDHNRMGINVNYLVVMKYFL